MSREENQTQRVVFIQDGSSELNVGAIRWILHGLSLKPGDELTLVSILHPAHSLITAFSGAHGIHFFSAGHKDRVVSHSMLGENHGDLDKEAKIRKEEYENHIEILQIHKFYEMHKVQFAIEVVAGDSTKAVALMVAKDLRATWIILDRHMKRYKAYFIDNLSCGISIMKHDDVIELLRGPTFTSISKNASILTYDEMLPGLPDEDDLFSIDITPAYYRRKQTVVPCSFATAEGLSAIHERNAEKIAHGMESVKLVTFGHQGCGTQIHKLGEDQNLPHGSTVHNLMHSLKTKNHFSQSLCSICKSTKTGWLRDFTYAELQAATDGFSAHNCLSEGGSGSVFKGIIGNKLNVAIKELNAANCRRGKEFQSEIHALPIAIQKNVIMILGCCWEGNHRLLVYEYACNGSLHQHLSKSRHRLTWTNRMKVALGASRGLNYLHQHNIAHGNVSSGCILLNHEYEPMIANFGLAQAYEEEKRHKSKISDEENLSLKADMHSFGVVLLELISGWGVNNDECAKKSLVRWATPLLQERKYDELIDPALYNSRCSHQLFWMARVAEKCLCKHTVKTVSMDKVLLALEHLVIEKKEAGFVHESFLPQKPHPVYSAPVSSKSSSHHGEHAAKERVTQDTEHCVTTGHPKSDISAKSTGHHIHFSNLFLGIFHHSSGSHHGEHAAKERPTHDIEHCVTTGHPKSDISARSTGHHIHLSNLFSGIFHHSSGSHHGEHAAKERPTHDTEHCVTTGHPKSDISARSTGHHIHFSDLFSGIFHHGSGSHHGEHAAKERPTHDTEDCETTSNPKSDSSAKSTGHIHFNDLFSGIFHHS